MLHFECLYIFIYITLSKMAATLDQQNNSSCHKGWKRLRGGWIAELDITGKTTEGRSNIKNPRFAKYRCSEAIVRRIWDVNEEWIEARKGYSIHDGTKYEVGQIIKPDSYDPNLNNVCSHGIHYFLSVHAAMCYSSRSKVGTHEKFHDNGQPRVKSKFVKKKLHGKYEEWYLNSTLKVKCTLRKGRYHGCYESFHSNGNRKTWCTYIKGKLHGVHAKWDKNGNLISSAVYLKGKEIG